MVKTFQYMLKQIKPILIEIVNDKDLGDFTFSRTYITQIVEKYHDKSSTINGTTNQIIDSYFIKKDKDIFLHPIMNHFLASPNNQVNILHYGLYRYVDPYFIVIEYLFNQFSQTYGIFQKRRDSLEMQLMNTFDPELAQRSKTNNISRALSNLEECNIIEQKKDVRGKVNIIIRTGNPDPLIFYYTLLDELRVIKFPGVNEGDILTKMNITKVWFLNKTNLSKILNNLMKLDYLSFGQLTGGTINFNKTKIEKWRFYYNF